MMIEEKDIIETGKFLKPHGLKGELNAFIDYDAEILEEDYPMIVDVEGIFVPFYAESVRPKGLHGSLVKIEGVDSVEDARRFVNKTIWMRRSDVAEFLDMDPDDVQTADDFIGYRVYDTDYGYLGTVEHLDDSTENLLLLVKPDGSGADDDSGLIYLPFNADFIESVDDDSREIHLNLPHGVIDLNLKTPENNE